MALCEWDNALDFQRHCAYATDTQHAIALCSDCHVGAIVAYLVPESTGKLHLGAKLDQGLLENQVLCMMQNR